jgi:integrase
VSRANPNLHQRRGYYYFFYNTLEGKRREESLRTRDADTANARYDQRTDEIRKGRSPNDLSDWTLESAAKRWLLNPEHLSSKGSRRSEQSIVRNLVRAFGASSRLRKLAVLEKVQEYQCKRLKEGRAAKTVNNEVTVLMGILRQAKLVVSDYKPLKTQKSDIPNALSQEESQRLLEIAARAGETAVAPFVAVLAWSTGMRSGEIRQLRLGDIHIGESKPYITVRRRTTKSDAGARRIALDRVAVWALRKLLRRAALIGSIKPEDHLLPTDRARHTRLNDPLHGEHGFDPAHPQSSWEWEWRALQQAARVNRRFHDLRHTYISRAAEAGVPVAVVQAQVGHMSKEMTAWYTHISEGAQQRAVMQMEAHDAELIQIIFRRDEPVVPAQADDSVRNSESHATAIRKGCRVRLRSGAHSSLNSSQQAQVGKVYS